MHLISSTKEFKLAGQATEGFPILLWEDMTSCQPANSFLRHYLMRGTIGSRKSWGQIGQAIYDYFGFLEAHKLDWQDTDRGEDKSLVAAYRDYCTEVVNLKRNTVRLRLCYVCQFYTFAFVRGLVTNLPYDEEERNVKSGAHHYLTNDTGGRNVTTPSVIPRRHRTLKKFLSKEQVKALLAATVNPHHRMLIRLALHTGLRREELATFPLAYGNLS